EKIAVYCGSSPGKNPAFHKAAVQLGKVLAEREITLVYGGGSLGLMGILAQTVIDQGGQVIGVIPQAIADMEVAFTDIQDLRVVENMHTRKALMAELADAFIALPGGMGTIEEIMEILTWAQLGFHEKPCGMLNIAGFYDQLLKFLDRLVMDQFIAPEHRSMLMVDESPQSLLEQFSSYDPPKIDKAKRSLKLSRTQKT
ncbi:MAG: TIGR00730 family Rossman fold protein, partial [Anaerolineales bacterium]|nr:TIGR00730 family Rossman fold protein [Anaerolineales bacterium]